ncbi:MAG: copper resistance D family protein, partial [bacterium]
GWAVLGRVTGAIVLALGMTAAMLPALSGHSGLHAGHTAASVSLAIHIVAVGIWVGGLIAVCAYVVAPGREPADGATTLRRFSVLALVCVLLLAESGLLNASLRVDGVGTLITTPYGTLILAKSVLLCALVVLGWRQRQVAQRDGWASPAARKDAVPQAGDGSGRAHLLRFAAFEVILMGVAIGLAVALSRTAPPAGAIAGDRITTGALTILALALPLVLVWAGARPSSSRPSGLARLTASYPEPFAVIVVVAAFAAPLNVASGLLPIGVATLVPGVVLVLAGWPFAIAATGPRGIPAIVLVMVLWIPALWWTTVGDPVETPLQVGLAILAGEACLALLLVVRARRNRPVVAAEAPEPAVRT